MKRYLQLALLAVLICTLILSFACKGNESGSMPDEDSIIDVGNVPDVTTPYVANSVQPDTASKPTLEPLILGTPDQGANTDPAPTPSPSSSPSAMPTATPLVPATTSPTTTPNQTPVSTGDGEYPYYLYFEKGSFTLTIYEKDENGEYTKVYKAYRAAHGGNKTPAGIFTISGRERWHEFPDGGFVQYAVKYHNRLYAHSPLYGKEDARVMWPKYYDGDLGIGKESTGGCLRMVTEAARFIYDNCPDGTTLEIVNGSPRGTTSDEPPNRNGKRFDPTDINVNG